MQPIAIPWPGQRPDLKDKLLAIEKKKYLAQLVITKRQSASDVASKFNLVDGGILQPPCWVHIVMAPWTRLITDL